MEKTKLLLSFAAASVLALNGCIDITRNDTLTVTYTDTGDGTDPGVTGFCTVDNTIAGNITEDLVLTQDSCIDGMVVVQPGASLTANNITIAGAAGTKAWLEILPGGKIFADTVLFTSEEEASGGTGVPGQWGGITIIGSDDRNEDGSGINTQLSGGYEIYNVLAGTGDVDDSSGSMVDCTLNNTGIAVAQDQEINGLSLYAVGSGTTMSGITVNRSGDDAVEIWGGHVALTDVTIVGAGDDGFDNDDGWAGSVTNLTVSGVTNSGLELSGTTHATYENVLIDTTGATALDDVGGAIYLKKDGIGGHFIDVNIVDKANNGYGTIVTDSADLANLSGTNVTIDATSTNTAGIVTEGPKYVDGTSATTTDVQDALGL